MAEWEQKVASTDKADQEKLKPPTDIVAVLTDQVTKESHQEAVPVHVGHQMRQKLELDRISIKFKVFLSHKVKEKGEAAEKMKTWLEVYATGKLDVFVSPAIEAAKRWNAEVFKKLSEADLLILLYTDPSADMDWCLFETGFFAGVSQMKPDRGLMCLLPKDLPAPKPLEDWENVEATDDGIKKMLRAIYANKKNPVNLDLFDDKKKSI